MSIGMGVSTVFTAAAADLNDTNGTVLQTVNVVKPLDVLRFGVINDNANDIATAAVLTLKRRPTAGTDTGAVTIAALSPSTAVDRGDGLYMDVVLDDDPDLGEAPERVRVNPGEELTITLTTQAGATASGTLFVEAIERPFQHTSGDPDEDRLGNMTAVTQ